MKETYQKPLITLAAIDAEELLIDSNPHDELGDDGQYSKQTMAGEEPETHAPRSVWED